MEKEEDDMNIDFGKILSFFKGKKEKSDSKVEKSIEKQTPSVSDEEDDNLGIDFGKIKNFFKPKDKQENKKESKKDDLGIDITKVYSFVKKHKVLLLLVLIIFLQFMPNGSFLPWGGIWMRMQTQNLPQTETWATNTVHSSIKIQIAGQINQQFPHLPDANKNKLIDEEFKKILKNKKGEINQQIQQTANFFLSKFQYEENGQTYTYMPDIDPYMFLLYARNYLDHGYTGDIKKDGINFDMHMTAPKGASVLSSIHPYTLAYIYKIFSIFNSNITLMQAACYFPIILILLSIIPAFLIGHKLAGNVGGFFSSAMIAVNNAAFNRTPWGHADTDAYNIFFPVFIIWIFFNSISAQNLKKKLFWGTCTGLALGVYSWAWGGWWYIFYFVLATIGITFLYQLFLYLKSSNKNPMQIKHLFILGILVFISASAFVMVTADFNTLRGALLSPIGFTSLKSAAHENLWPNVYTTVAELNPASIKQVIESVGGNLLAFIGFLGILLALVKTDKKTKQTIAYSVLLIIWFVGTSYASSKGIRFALLLVPALSVAFGVALGKLYILITRYASKELNLNKFLTGTVLIIIFSMLLIGPVKASYNSSIQQAPIINDAWWTILTNINEKSEPDAIINSWWDFGHHFKFIADRSVTFDGASQNTPMAHWIGKVLLTDNEKQAKGILRMLDCGSNDAFEEINKEFDDSIETMTLLYQIIELDKKEAKKILSKKVTNPDEILKLTHCDAPENYFITSADMVQKSGVWAHFGGWDFEKAYIWINLRNKPQAESIKIMIDKLGYTEEKAEEVYFNVKAINDEKEANNWISSWPGYASEPTECTKDKDSNKLKCGNGITIDLDNLNVKLKVQGGEGIPESLVYINKNKEFTEKTFKQANLPFKVVLIPSGENYKSMLVSPELAKSMFTRLFFMQGHGLKYFKLFDSQTQINGKNIFTWKIDWKGKEKNIHSDLIKKTKVSDGDNILINYIGWLDNGTVFDSNIQDWLPNNITKDSEFKNQKIVPLDFKVGSTKVIPGLDRGVIGMTLKQTKTIKIKPENAYGTDPKKHLLGNKSLNFKVQIISIK